MDDFWIPVSFNGRTHENLSLAITSCHRVHTITVIRLNNHFSAHAEVYKYNQFREEFYHILKEENLPAQRYSLINAAEKTFPYFNQNKKIKKGKFIPVDPLPREDFHEIQFETRQVWKKYLVLNSLITTAYGNIDLDESWVNVIGEQAEEREIAFESIPLLWHSVTLFLSDEEQKIKFNLHKPDSRFGKEALKRVEST